MQKLNDTLKNIVISINFIFYNFEAFLGNVIDVNMITGYFIFVLYVFQVKFTLDFKILFFPFLLHFSYAICYVINDIIDYGDTKKHANNMNDVTHSLRPIYHLGRSTYIITYAFCLYVASIVLICTFFCEILLPTLTFAIITTVLTLAHSIPIKWQIRAISFFFLRLTKYSYLTIILNYYLTDTFLGHNFTYVFLSLILPYSIYRSIDYPKKYGSRNYKKTVFCGLAIYSAVAIFIYFATIASLSLANLIAIVLPYSLVLMPCFIFGYLSRIFIRGTGWAIGLVRQIFVALSTFLLLLIYVIKFI